MTSAPAILNARAAWLAERRSLVTASDAAAILGVDPRRSALAVFAEKVGAAESEDSIPARWGRRMQAAIVEGYREETGRYAEDCDPYALLRHPEIPWLASTLDAVTAGSLRNPAPVAWEDPATSPGQPLEIKAMGEWRREARDEELPLAAQVQNQIQQACARASWGSLAAFVGITKPVLWIDVPRNDDFLALAIPRLEVFLWHVRRKEAPPEWADAMPSSAEAIKRLWPGVTGETVALDHDAGNEMADLERARAAVRKAEKEEAALVGRLQLRMGTAAFGALLDGSYVRRQRIPRSAYQAKATSYIKLDRWRPKVPRKR